ncbi:MAG: tryptophan/tyrosine permease [Gammaproteobacteria bacterium]|nr:tryptophan/tyrosine permease [Gammaproteobacteria bacterium]
MNSRFIGAIFLILGTCIGGSMLALPMATAQEGVTRTIIIMLGAWAMMMIGAFALLRVNLKLPENSNLISMSKETLGKTGAVITWVITLALLYTLLAAYISSGEDLLGILFEQFKIQTPMWLNAVLFTVCLGFIVYKGIRLVDYVNRGLMSSKLLICIILILLLIPFTAIPNLSFRHLQGNGSAITCITAFGYACIIPSIRSYLSSDTKKLYWAIFLGGLIPLIFYLAWIFVVQATIPTATDLSAMYSNTHPLKAMVLALANHVNNRGINILTNLFTSLCVLTSFLGVALSLADFLADGMRLKKQTNNLLIVGLALAPPLAIVLLWPAIFLRALNYAGILCLALLFVIPLLMLLSTMVQKHKWSEIIME